MAYTQKKGKTWNVYVKQPDGRYRSYSKPPNTADRFTTKNAALNWGREEESRVNSGSYVDPRGAETPWDDWWTKWIAANDVDEATVAFYTDLWRVHIQPRYGPRPIGATDSAEVDAWLKALRAGEVETGPPNRRRQRVYAPRTTEAIRKLMKLMLGDATTARPKLLDSNPLEQRRAANRGRRVDRVKARQTVRPKLGAEPEQVLAAAVNMHLVVGPGTLAGIGAFMRVLTAGWMGMRPGEQAALGRLACAGLGRPTPVVVVDPDEGNYEELAGEDPRLKAPKGGDGRLVVAPVGYAALLAAWLEYNQGPAVFPGPEHERWHRRRWDYRWQQAAAGGVLSLRGPGRAGAAGEYVLERATPGLEFKGLRRVHNVWLTELGVPDIARTHRLGHAMSDEMQSAYSLVSATLERQLLAGLQEYWVRAFSGFAGVAALGIIGQFCPPYAEKTAVELGVPRRAIEAASTG